MFWKVFVGFHQTYTSDVLWDRSECIKFWGRKVALSGYPHSTFFWIYSIMSVVDSLLCDPGDGNSDYWNNDDVSHYWVSELLNYMPLYHLDYL